MHPLNYCIMTYAAADKTCMLHPCLECLHYDMQFGHIQYWYCLYRCGGSRQKCISRSKLYNYFLKLYIFTYFADNEFNPSIHPKYLLWPNLMLYWTCYLSHCYMNYTCKIQIILGLTFFIECHLQYHFF